MSIYSPTLRDCVMRKDAFFVRLEVWCHPFLESLSSVFSFNHHVYIPKIENLFHPQNSGKADFCDSLTMWNKWMWQVNVVYFAGIQTFLYIYTMLYQVGDVFSIRA